MVRLHQAFHTQPGRPGDGAFGLAPEVSMCQPKTIPFGDDEL